MYTIIFFNKIYRENNLLKLERLEEEGFEGI